MFKVNGNCRVLVRLWFKSESKCIKMWLLRWWTQNVSLPLTKRQTWPAPRRRRSFCLESEVKEKNAMVFTPKHRLVIYGYNDTGFIVALRTADDVSTLNKRVYVVPSALSPRHYLTKRTSYSWIQACVHQITAWFSLLKLIKERQPSPIIKGLEYLRVQSKILQDCVWWRKGENEWKALNYLEISEGFFFADCADHSARYLSFTKLQFDAQTTVFVQESSKQWNEGRGSTERETQPACSLLRTSPLELWEKKIALRVLPVIKLFLYPILVSRFWLVDQFSLRQFLSSAVRRADYRFIVISLL